MKKPKKREITNLLGKKAGRQEREREGGQAGRQAASQTIGDKETLAYINAKCK